MKKKETIKLTYKDIPGWFDFEDVYNLIYKHIKNGMFIEVGSFLGKSTAYMANLLKTKGDKFGFIQVDTWKGTPIEHTEIMAEHGGDIYDKFIKNMTDCGFLNIITPYRMTSKEAAYKLPLNSCDAVYIDADHSYDAVNQDIELWLERVKPGGILAGHDIDFPDVWQAVRWHPVIGKNFKVKNRS